ncbi:hypothetical protein PB01_09285 [Psychrobacillus glaciei]|uniref:Uncharacterized protein n=1 Tax=Psychrobacillus glaciei TaxID=2283160 RepID=A0A5J6SMJ3_9BACI|nr:hypothetical protein [Psychrobacillus glaciei]QFF99009.1 hypothetical protein PB01_09285 [Psychrobacillus glaciei]
MIKKYSTLLILLVLAISIILIINKENNNINSNSKVEDSNKYSIDLSNTLKGSYMNLFDENDRLVKSYSEEQIKKQLIDTKLYKRAHEDGEIFADFIDENGLIINPPEEIKEEVKELSKSNEFKLYVLHSFSFNKNIFVGRNNKAFSKPQSIIIEPIEKFESMSIILENSTGNKIRKIEIGNYLGALIVPLEDFELEDSYSIQLINNKQDKPIYLYGGIVIYK